MGGGEAGPEAIAPIDTLMQFVRAAVSEGRDADTLRYIAALLERYLPMFAELRVLLDTGALVGQLAPAMDGALSGISARRERGLAVT